MSQSIAGSFFLTDTTCVVYLLETSCEPGWVMYDGSCYLISNGNSLGLRYEYAEQFCNYKHSSLAVITSVEEAEWLATVT